MWVDLEELQIEFANFYVMRFPLWNTVRCPRLQTLPTEGPKGFPRLRSPPSYIIHILRSSIGIEMMKYWIVRASLEPHLGIMKFSASAEKILSKEFLAWRD